VPRMSSLYPFALSGYSYSYYPTYDIICERFQLSPSVTQLHKSQVDVCLCGECWSKTSWWNLDGDCTNFMVLIPYIFIYSIYWPQMQIIKYNKLQIIKHTLVPKHVEVIIIMHCVHDLNFVFYYVHLLGITPVEIWLPDPTLHQFKDRMP